MEIGPGGGIDFFTEGEGHYSCSGKIPPYIIKIKELLRRCLSRYACCMSKKTLANKGNASHIRQKWPVKDYNNVCIQRLRQIARNGWYGGTSRKECQW